MGFTQDQLLDLIEQHDAHFELQFIVDDEVVSKISANDVTGIIEQSYKLDNAELDWANEELIYSQADADDRWSKDNG